MFTLSDLIICGFAGLSLCCGIAVALLSFLNKKRFSTICTLYKEKFGSLPAGAIIFDSADSIGFSSGYAAKINFIVNPLIFGKAQLTVQMMMLHLSETCHLTSKTGLSSSTLSLL
jgi:hypothetical protein